MSTPKDILHGKANFERAYVRFPRKIDLIRGSRTRGFIYRDDLGEYRLRLIDPRLSVSEERNISPDGDNGFLPIPERQARRLEDAITRKKFRGKIAETIYISGLRWRARELGSLDRAYREVRKQTTPEHFLPFEMAYRYLKKEKRKR